MFEQQVDARYLLCPMPVIKTQQAIEGIVSGEVLRVVCTDPGVEQDIPAWVRVHGHRLLSAQTEMEGTVRQFIFEIEKVDD